MGSVTVKAFGWTQLGQEGTPKVVVKKEVDEAWCYGFAGSVQYPDAFYVYCDVITSL